MNTDNAILSTRDLAVGYRNGKQETILLKGLNLVLEKGKLVALLGQNGAGNQRSCEHSRVMSNPWEGRLR